MSYKHHTIFTFVLVIVAFIFQAGCKNQESWHTYNNDTYKYSIDYPSGWSLNDQFKNDQLAMLKSPDGKVTISVLVGDSSGRNLDQQVNYYSSIIKGGSFFYQIVSDKTIKLQGIDARQRMVAYQDSKDTPKYVSIELYLIEKGKAFLLRCTATETDLKSLPPDYQRVLSTFKLNN
jgi:hypothetical protein